MRFHARLTGLFISQLLCCVVWFVAVSRGRALSSPSRITALIYVGLALFTLVAWFFTYWEVRSDGLFERMLFRTRVVPFDEITRVSPALYKNKPRPGWLDIQFVRSGPAFEVDQTTFDRGSLLFAPAHSDRFLTALRHAAPQASFETP